MPPILHVDMDAFFASVEQRDDVSLRGKPVLVGGTGRRGVVSAASYEARAFGCRSAMPMAEATRLCPHAIVRRVRMAAYAQASHEVMAILADLSPLVQPMSVDEAFVDLSGTERLHSTGATVRPDANGGADRRVDWRGGRGVAELLRARIRRQLDLPASVGLAPNKFLAKLASDLAKPDGLLVVDEQWIREVLPRLPVARLWGVGPVTERRLVAVGLRTFGALAAAPESLVRSAVGDDAARLAALARGEDDRPVETDRDAKSIGCERTFGHDVVDITVLRSVLLGEVEQVGRRLRAAGARARTVTLKLRWEDFTTLTRRCTLPDAVNDTLALWRAAQSLLNQLSAGGAAGGAAGRAPGGDPMQGGHSRIGPLPAPVRLIGVSLSGLEPAGAPTMLFTDPEAERRRVVDEVSDAVTRKFGVAAIRRAGALPARRADGHDDD